MLRLFDNPGVCERQQSGVDGKDPCASTWARMEVTILASTKITNNKKRRGPLPAVALLFQETVPGGLIASYLQQYVAVGPVSGVSCTARMGSFLI